jgi:hypothetical protein
MLKKEYQRVKKRWTEVASRQSVSSKQAEADFKKI